MSRERPMPGPKALPDAQRGVKLRDRRDKGLKKEEREKLASFSGPGFIGYLGATFSRGRLERAPQFIRRGYEASIVEELGEFFRLRPWRPKSRRSGMTWKERQKMLRRAENAGQLRRVGGGRFEIAKVSPHA